ncbi:MAG: NAD(P)/FAD-dependent oxidoreductase [Clostridia bacterium]
MHACCKRLKKRLSTLYGNQISVAERDGCILLTGSLDHWEDIVQAGRMAVNKRRYQGVINDIRLRGQERPPMRIPPFTDNTLEGSHPDVMIIGAGVIGCAVARELMRWKLHVLLCDKEHDVALHASSRNDGMIHPGIDLLPGQVKRRYNMRGNHMYDRISSELDVPFHRLGQYLCFQKRCQLFAAFVFVPYFCMAGLKASFVTRRTLKQREPELSGNILGALHFPSAGIVSPYHLTIAYAENAVDNGAILSLDTAVLNMCVQNGQIRSVLTNRGIVYPKIVINAAGVFSDDLAKMAQDRTFSIHPRRGTNAILDHKATHQLLTIASSYPATSQHKQHTKGGGLVRTVDENILVGPDAFETYEKEDFSTTAQSIQQSFEKQQRTSPQLSQRDVITYFTGVRAATYEEDFVIRKGLLTKNIVEAAGIQSPGLTAAPAIAEDVAKMAIELLAQQHPVSVNPSFNPIRKGIVSAATLSDSDRTALIARDPDYGEIICRCEEISKGEILAALRRNVPCDSIDGVKRRVRPGMGRCQGGFCGPLVAEIIANEKGIPLESVKKSGYGSEVLCGDTKEEW